jgi:hypothetical protein
MKIIIMEGFKMNYIRNRKYPRVYNKKETVGSERIIDLSVAAAAGIVALAFFKGMFWGYIIKRRLG